MLRALIAATAVLTVAAPAHASTKRIAVIVGNNAGNPGLPALHYAGADAAKFARVLTELGGVEPADLFLLQDRSAADLGDTFARVRQRIADLRSDPEARIVVVFYFSGHSDGVALELGRDRVLFSELRAWLASVGADVRVALIDTCKSGALLSAKGGRPGGGFQIRITDELASTGEVLLTSSAADEVALESKEIAGSFFTHHFISGLRGAADSSGDGLVTLSEAYRYAYARTVKTTGETTVGAQHPAYDYRLSGQGELVLTELSKRTATIELPDGFDRIIVVDTARDQVIAEVVADTRAAIAVPPGHYAIRASRGAAMFAGAIAVDRSPRVVRSEELAPIATASTTRKGATANDAIGSLMVSAGETTGVARLGAMPGVRVALATAVGLSLSIDAASRAGALVRESYALALAGFRHSFTRGGWSVWAGAELGAGAAMQSPAPIAYSGVFAAGGAFGISRDVWRGMAIGMETTLRGELLARDDRINMIMVPAGWLGVVIRR